MSGATRGRSCSPGSAPAAAAPLLAKPFPSEWATILTRDVAHYRVLNEPHRATVRECVQMLVAELNWEGANGLVVTDRMRVVVAAGVSLLMLRDRHDYFRRVPSVILYPGPFRRPDSDDVLAPDLGELSGEAADRGPVVLSWPDARDELADPSPGYNLVVTSSPTNSITPAARRTARPRCPTARPARRWQAAFEPALARHLATPNNSLFSPDAIDPVEFFADGCEAFFASPADLLAHESRVYGELAAYFGVDPAEWHRG